ncbi:beta-lactamase family protein [Pseudoxanthomonas sp. NC8]|nr:beta-lactamase family protein [Pseudoxanthomonas sp. NC8]
MQRNLDFARRFAGLLLLPALLCWNGAWAAVPADAAAADFDVRMQQLMHEGGLVGAGAAILVGPEVRWMQGYGWADREQGVVFTPDTVMNVASISKTVTGVALMQAVQAGRLELDRDVNDYLPFRLVNPHAPGAVVTLRHLTTHTSGITDRPDAYARAYVFGRDPEQALGTFLTSYLWWCAAGTNTIRPTSFRARRAGIASTPTSARRWPVTSSSARPASAWTRGRGSTCSRRCGWTIPPGCCRRCRSMRACMRSWTALPRRSCLTHW